MELLPTSVAQSTFDTKLKNKVVLLDNPVKLTSAEKKEQIKANRELGQRKTMNAKERRIKRVFDLPPETAQYQRFLPLNQLWVTYLRELLGENWQSSDVTAGTRLLKADFQGSIMGVEKSKNPLLLGLEGICVQETKDTFKVVTKDNEFKVLPKQNTVFYFHFDTRKILLFGNRLRQRQSSRAKKVGKKQGSQSIEL